MALNRLHALQLLAECTGDDIWSIEHCQQRGVPASWMDELGDCFESGFDRDSDTIYVQNRATNQYQGIRDVDLAIKLGEYLGLDVQDAINRSFSRRDVVRSLREQAEEG